MNFTKKRFGARNESLKVLERTFVTEAKRMGFMVSSRDLCSTNSCYIDLSDHDHDFMGSPVAGQYAGKIRISDHETGRRGDWDIDATIYTADQIPAVLQKLFAEVHGE